MSESVLDPTAFSRHNVAHCIPKKHGTNFVAWDEIIDLSLIHI